jgi:hypothetical protein
MTTEELLTALAFYLAGQALAQYNGSGSYLDHPDMPAVLFGDSDVPDTALVLTVVGTDPGLGDTDVAFGYRATGTDSRAVEHLADAVFDHFRSVIGVRAATFDSGTALVLPELDWDGITVANIERIARGTAELTSPAKHKGARFVRSDT